MNKPNKKTILITCYAINPYKGSEDGTAWNMVAQLMRHNKLIVITRENNQEHIDRYFSEHEIAGSENVKFEYFDLPYWMRFWKKGGRGALLYFYMWQFGIVSFIKKRKLKFDIAHNLNFHSDWTPSFLWRLKKPFVWGPVGHHHKIPKDYLVQFYGKKQHYIDLVKWITKLFFWNIDPFLKIAKRKAHKIIAINTSVIKMMHIPREKAVLIPAVGSNPIKNISVPKSNERFEILSIGRFVPLKGFDITVQAFAKFYNALPTSEKSKVKLTLVGKGPYDKILKKLIEKEGVSDGVEMINWIEQSKLWDIYKKANLFFFPSHEGAGMVVPEAMSFGVPVLCFDNYGPGEFITSDSGESVPYTTYEESITAFAQKLTNLYNDKKRLANLQIGALARFENHFDWAKKGVQISAIYEEL